TRGKVHIGPMAETASTAPSDAFRERLLDAMLEIAAETGWTELSLGRAAERAGLSAGQVQLATPNGVGDLLEALGRRAARAAADRAWRARRRWARSCPRARGRQAGRTARASPTRGSALPPE